MRMLILFRSLMVVASALTGCAPAAQTRAMIAPTRDAQIEETEGGTGAGFATGRRMISTAFVQLGPGDALVVTELSGRDVILRNVVMNAGDYCGTRIDVGASEKRFCGRYAEVAAARIQSR